MSVAFFRSVVVPNHHLKLTAASRRILAYILDAGAAPALSTRKLSHALDLSRRTVQVSLTRLNEAGCIRTIPGGPAATAVHEVLLPTEPVLRRAAAAAGGGR